MQGKSREKLIKTLKELGVIRKQSVKLSHAGYSNFYVDLKKAYGYPDMLELIAQELWKTIDKKANCIAVGGYGGIPLGVMIATEHNLKLTLVRGESKTHGTSSMINGYIPGKKDKIWIVDDVLTTGGSIKKIIKILKQTKVKILGGSVVVKREDVSIGVPLKHILEVEELF